MAKVQGPLFSLKAAGTFAKTLTFQGRAGTTAVFIPKTPYDTKTVTQLGIRAYIKSGVSYWQGLSPAYQTQWNNFVI